MDQKLKFQSKEYHFPKYLWFNYYFAHRDDTGIIPFTLYVTNLNKKKAMETAQEVAGQFTTSENATLLPTTVIAKLRFCELFPLKKEYWQKPDFEFDRDREIETLFQALYKPDLYYLVVTPSYYQDKSRKVVSMGLGLATLKTRISDVPLWMKNSGMPVIYKAKHAAFYEFESLYVYDKEGSLTKIDNMSELVDLGFDSKKSD